MSDNWKSYTIQDFIEKGEADLKTGPFGTQLHASDYVEQGTPVINVRNIGFGNVRSEKFDFVDAETVARLSGHLLTAGDIVFGRKGAVERHAFIQHEQEGWFQGSDCLRLRLNSPSVSPRFVSYLFLTPDHQQWMINQSSHGATMSSLNQDIVSRIPLRLPPLPVQRQIAGVLSAYDDLIENNARRIALLEALAQILYREWFVRFRFPGHEAVERVASELGPIPAGWEVVKLKKVAEVNRSNLSSSDPPEDINYINIGSVSTGRVDGVEQIPYKDAPSRARRIVQHGDIIWSSVRPNLQAYALILNPKPNTIVSTGFAVLTPTKLPYTYLYQAVTTEQFVSYLTNLATGSAYPAVKVTDFKNAQIMLPSQEIVEAFHNIVSDLYEEKQVLHHKNMVLRTTRDLLLPRLVSGEVDVSEVAL
jgi:type I restriction enzyme S subunit